MSRKFLASYTKDFKFIAAGRDDFHALCTCCNQQIDLSSKGNGAITQHQQTKKHTESAKTAAETQALTQFLKPKRTTGDDQVAAAEGSWCYHIARHGQAFQSADCTSSSGLFKAMFPDSNVAKEFACARKKTTKIITSKSSHFYNLLFACFRCLGAKFRRSSFARSWSCSVLNFN